MDRCVCLTVVLALLSVFQMAQAQGLDLETLLTFEGGQDNGVPSGWGGSANGTVFFDGTVVHGGDGAARLERGARSPDEFSTLTHGLPVDFAGRTVELRGFLRTENVRGFVGLWLRQDGEGGSLALDNMQDRGVRGTTPWTEYAVALPLDGAARDLYFGVLIVGEGTVWADDLQLLVDGEPVSEAPARVIEETVLDTDREFDEGSGITLTSLTTGQVENLAVLAKVWGFLKYHHPRVAAGELHWDYELFRVLPGVLAAQGPDARNLALSRWVDRLGVPTDCDPCATPPENVHLRPRLRWLGDADLLGPTLSRQLQAVYRYRFADGEQFYVSLETNVGNPVFARELAYPGRQDDPGFRLLALFRYWNVVEYWFPYRDQIEGDWDAVLREFLPRFAAATTWDAYRLELFALIARVGDTHANLWSELEVRPPRGPCRWPVALRFVEGQATVTVLSGEPGERSGLEVGDVIRQVDGQTVEALVKAWRPYYSASNEAARLRDLVGSLPQGRCGASELVVERGGEPRTVVVARRTGLDPTPPPHDRPGGTFQRLSPEVAYLKLSSVRAADVDDYLARAAGTRGLVIDIRNYPSEFVVFALGSRLVERPTPFARFTTGDLANPGAFTWTEPLVLPPGRPGYRGKVAILVDESSISQAEYTAMAFRAAPRAAVVGSTTAGADGNVSAIPLPGGLETLVSGIGVFYPDKTPTQRVGIVPDIAAAPTLAGVRAGRDEVLEAALRHILGPAVDEATVRSLAK